MILIYSAEGCVLCKKAKDVLAREGVEFEERPCYVREGVDVQRAAANMADAAELGWPDRFPLIVRDGRVLATGDDVMAGFTERVRGWK